MQAYYTMTYGEFCKHASLVNGHWHTDDEVLTDDSIVTLKVTAEDHIHIYLENQPNITKHPLPYEPEMQKKTVELGDKHPLLGMRSM